MLTYRWGLSVRLVTPVFRVFTSMQFLSLARSEMPSESGVSSEQ